MRRLSPPQIIIASFLIAIVCGTLLLCLPIATRSGERLNFVDSLFTITSATCVTGLAVKDTGSFFSFFGQMVILLFIQLGGLGILTFSTLFTIFLGKKFTISQSVIIKDALGRSKIEGLKDLIKYILLITFFIEIIGAAILYLRWSFTTQWNPLFILKTAAFHSISAFCNAGFSLFSNSLQGWRADTTVMLVMTGLIITGGLGFVVILQLRHYITKPLATKVNLQTKVVLAVTAILILTAAIGVYLLENNHMLKDMDGKEKLLTCLFTSVTPRTAGFGVLPTGGLQIPTLFLITMLMFIGASPGSTGGGIKTVTAAILASAAFSMLKGKDRIVLFKRTIDKNAYRRSMVIFVLSMLLIVVSTMLLTITERAMLKGTNTYFLNLFFETTSAFATCGLSTGVTPQLTVLGKLIIIATMFLGRIGPLTAALALAMQKEEKITYRYPEEEIMVG